MLLTTFAFMFEANGREYFWHLAKENGVPSGQLDGVWEALRFLCKGIAIIPVGEQSAIPFKKPLTLHGFKIRVARASLL